MWGRIISTHALTEGDWTFYDHGLFLEISTHALTEGDVIASVLFLRLIVFQLTPSRRATYPEEKTVRNSLFQLTPSRRATQIFWLKNRRPDISTHALTEGDIPGAFLLPFFKVFQLTPSRRATGRHEYSAWLQDISTHALTEGDGRIQPEADSRIHFNSRPHGGRLYLTSLSL